MSETKKCPKCSAEMLSGTVTRDFRILKQGDLVGDNVQPFFCRDCGFIELYKKPSTKEPWRRQGQQEQTRLRESQQPKERQPSTETPRKKLIR